MRRLVVLVLLVAAVIGGSALPASATTVYETKMVAVTPGWISVGRSFDVGGYLSWPTLSPYEHDTWVEGAVKVTRTGPDGTVTFTNTLYHENFFFKDTLPVKGEYVYTFTYPGDETHSAVTKTNTMRADPLASYFDSLPSGWTWAGGYYTFVGKLNWPTAVVHVTRTSASETRALDDVITGDDGTFTVVDGPLAAGDYTYTMSYDGDATRMAATVSATVEARLQPTELVVTGAWVATIDEPYTFNGTLSWPSSPVRISRRDPAGESFLAEVVTDQSGAFSITDVPRAAGVPLYLVRYAGTDTRAPAESGINPTIYRGSSALSLTAPASATAGSSHVVTGVLDPAVNSATVHVTRVTETGTETLPDVTVAADGTFAIPDTPVRSGLRTYTVTWDGNENYEGSTASVSFTVAPQPTTLTVGSNSTSYGYGDVATVTATLSSATTNRVVRIYARPYGQAATQIGEGTVNAAGVLTARYTLRTNTTFSAAFAGDERYQPASAQRAVRAAARLTQRLDGRYATSGSYALFRRTVDPALAVSVTPSHAGRCMTYEAQIYSLGAWRYVMRNTCVQLDRYSRTNVRMTATPRPGYRYRVRATFNGDSLNAKTHGTWLYFTFS